MSLLKNIKTFQSWNKTKAHLRNAFSLIPIASVNEVRTQHTKSFEEYLGHNELELAFDEIEALTEMVNLPKEFWRELLLAAQEMQITEHAERCQAKLNSE